MMTSDEENTIRNLWAHGFSAENIASQLEGWSRNRVIVAVHEMGLAGRMPIITGSEYELTKKVIIVDELKLDFGTLWDEGIVEVFAEPKRRKIVSPPGFRLLRFLEFVFPKRFFEAVLKQTVLDMQEEHMEALSEKKFRLARWVHARVYISIGLAIFAAVPATVLGKFSALSKPD